MTHVLAVRLDSDGDVLVTGPAMRALAAGASRVTMLCGPRGRAAAELLPGVDELVCFTAPWIDPEPPPVSGEAVESLLEEIRSREIDEAVVFTSFHQSALPTALVLRLAGVARISAISDDYPGSLLDVRHRVPDDIHEVERALSLAAAAGFSSPPRDDLRLAVALEPTPPPLEPTVIVHPGASVPARAPTPETCRELVGLLADDGYDVLVTGGPGECDLTAFVAGGHVRAVDLGGRTTLAELASLVAGARAIVCGNTGPAHLAAAVGTPVVSIFAPTVPAVRWRPWAVPHVLLGSQGIACAGCRARVCPVPGHPCIGRVSAHEIRHALGSLLEESVDVSVLREAGLKRAMTVGGGAP
jgi:ADP-heptose:LPS heptosyltransferase